MNKKISLIAIIVFLSLLSFQFSNCESVKGPVQTTSTTPPNNGDPYYPSSVPNNTPREIDPTENHDDPLLPPGEDACDDYNFVDDRINRLRENGDPNKSWRFGYYCLIGEDCINEPDQISTVHIAWYKGTSGAERQRSSNINVYEILNNCDSNPPQLNWERRANMQGTWIYDRYGSSPPPSPPSTNNDDTRKTGGDSGGSTSGGGTGTTTLSSETPLGQCSVPNRLSIVQEVARAHPNLLRNSNNCIKPATNGNYDFLEKVLVELRKTDSKWGYYHRTQHNLNHASYDAIAYYCGSGNGNRSSDLRFVDIISSSCQAQWDDTSHERHKNRANPANGYWKYPRTGSGGGSSSGGGSVSGGNSDFSDFNFSKVTWLDQNVSGWAETSRITSIQVKSGGQICINDTERGQWPTGNPLGGGPLDGNPWVFVKINGRYYGATYEWLRPGQICKFGHENTKPLSKVYNSAWRGHIRLSPLKQWVARPGEVVGFMVSGFARHSHTRPNVRKRTNVQFYRLPATDGRGGAMLGTYSSSGGLSGGTSGGTGSGSRGYSTCNSRSTRRPPNLQREVQKLAEAHRVAYRAVWNGSKYTNDYRFLDLVVARFREIDNRFGYNCVRGGCSRISADAVAYFRGEGSPNNSADVQIIDFLRGAGRNTPIPAWTDVTQETCEKGSIGRWKYPRTGSASPGSSSGGSGISGGSSGGTGAVHARCGRCGSNTQNPCSSGTYHPHPGANATDYRWTCRNNPHKRLAQCNNKREVPCRASKSGSSPPKAVARAVECGKCGRTLLHCVTGDRHPHPGHTTTHYRWTCRNRPHRASSSCNGRREVACAISKTAPSAGPVDECQTDSDCTDGAMMQCLGGRCEEIIP